MIADGICRLLTHWWWKIILTNIERPSRLYHTEGWVGINRELLVHVLSRWQGMIVELPGWETWRSGWQMHCRLPTLNPPTHAEISSNNLLLDFSRFAVSMNKICSACGGCDWVWIGIQYSALLKAFESFCKLLIQHPRKCRSFQETFAEIVFLVRKTFWLTSVSKKLRSQPVDPAWQAPGHSAREFQTNVYDLSTFRVLLCNFKLIGKRLAQRSS